MQRLRAILAGPLALAAAFGLAAPASAGPAMSEWSRQVERRADDCIAWAAKQMTADGWTDVHKGDGDLLTADKGRLSGVVMCLGGGLFDHHCTALAVITGGDDGDASTAADRLRVQVTGK